MDNNKKNYIIYSSIILTIYLSGFFFYHFYFADDIYRSINGVFGWDSNGRLLTNLIFKFIAFKGSVDVYPLGLIVGVFAVILSADRIRVVLFKGDISSGVIAVLLCLASPFLLQVYSYRYDSLTMALSMALAIYTAFWPRKDNFIVSVLIRTALLLCIWLLYQPAISLFLALSFILFIELYFLQKKNNIKLFVVEYILSILLSVVIYLISIRTFISGEYSLAHSSVVNLSLAGMQTVIFNILTFFYLIKLTFSGHFEYLYYFYFVIFIASPFVFLILVKDELNFIKRIIFLLSPLVLLFLSFSVLCFLKFPVFQFRTMIGFSGVIIYTFYFLYKICGKKNSIWLMMPLVLSFFVVANVYPKSQYIRYNAYLNVLDSIATKMDDLKDINDTIYISGDMPVTPENKYSSEAYPIVKYSLKKYFKGLPDYH